MEFVLGSFCVIQVVIDWCWFQSDAAKKKKTDEPTEDVPADENEEVCSSISFWQTLLSLMHILPGYVL